MATWEGKAGMWDPGAQSGRGREGGRWAVPRCLGRSYTGWPVFRGLQDCLHFPTPGLLLRLQGAHPEIALAEGCF